MAGTIEFYAKPIPWAVEVKNIRAYTLLTTKFHAASPKTLQGTPERSFCCGHVVAKSLAIIFLFCSVCFSCRIVHRGFSCNNVEICGILFSYRPHPQPLPLKGGECLRSPRIFNRTVRKIFGDAASTETCNLVKRRKNNGGWPLKSQPPCFQLLGISFGVSVPKFSFLKRISGTVPVI